MLTWFKRQSTGVQTLTIAVIVVLFLALVTSGDEGSDDSAASSTTPAAAAEAPMNAERPPGPAADEAIAAFSRPGCPSSPRAIRRTPALASSTAASRV